MDTKSRSIIRIKNRDEKQPTHLEMLKFLKEKYSMQTQKIVKKIITCVTENTVYDILNKYEEILSEQKRTLIQRYLLSKIQLIEEVYGEDVV